MTLLASVLAILANLVRKLLMIWQGLQALIPASYQTIRIGMNVTDAICRDVIDTGIGFINFQQVELEHRRGETVFLRIDQLAGLRLLLFLLDSIYCARTNLQQPELVQGFLKATQRGAAFTTEHPEEAYELLCQAKPQLRTPMYQKIFTHTLPFFSRSLLNVDRDWDKVGRYTQAS